MDDDDPDPDLDLLDMTTWKIQQFRNKRKKNDEFLRSLMSAIIQVPDNEWGKLKKEARTFINRISPKKTRVKTSDKTSSRLKSNNDKFNNLFSISFPDSMADNTEDSGSTSSSSAGGGGASGRDLPASFGDIVDPRKSALARSLEQRSASSSDMEDEPSEGISFQDELDEIIQKATQVDGAAQARINAILQDSVSPKDAVMGILSLMNIYHDDTEEKITSMLNIVTSTAKKTKKNQAELKSFKDFCLKRFKEIDAENAKKKTWQIEPGLNDSMDEETLIRQYGKT